MKKLTNKKYTVEAEKAATYIQHMSDIEDFITEAIKPVPFWKRSVANNDTLEYFIRKKAWLRANFWTDVRKKYPELSDKEMSISRDGTITILD